MKTGIYIPGLGQSFVNESLEKYATRLMREMSYATDGIRYELKQETVEYADDQQSKVASIFAHNETGAHLVYKFYEFDYNALLCDGFRKSSLIKRNLQLFWLVIRKFPLLLGKLFRSGSYDYPFQTFYLFFIFFILALAAVSLLPASVGIIDQFIEHGDGSKSWVETSGLGVWMGLIVSGMTLLVFFVPHAQNLVLNLATEFLCVNNYLEYGERRQLVLGQLEQLVEYVAEHEKGSKLHYHAYSFGNIVALDYLFPFSSPTTANTRKLSEALISIGTPVAFIRAYYPRFFHNRETTLQETVCWINIYSICDALGTNYRRDAKAGDAQFGLTTKSEYKPFNFNYEVAAINPNSFGSFISLYGVKAHALYWDKNPEGKSCMGIVYRELTERNLIGTGIPVVGVPPELPAAN